MSTYEYISTYHENISSALQWILGYQLRGFKVDYWLAADEKRYITTAKRENK
jgi:hypothetical protein